MLLPDTHKPFACSRCGTTMCWIKHEIGYMPDSCICNQCADDEALVTRWLKLQPNYTYLGYEKAKAAIVRNTASFNLRQNLIMMTRKLRPEENINLAGTENA